MVLSASSGFFFFSSPSPVNPSLDSIHFLPQTPLDLSSTHPPRPTRVVRERGGERGIWRGEKHGKQERDSEKELNSEKEREREGGGGKWGKNRRKKKGNSSSLTPFHSTSLPPHPFLRRQDSFCLPPFSCPFPMDFWMTVGKGRREKQWKKKDSRTLRIRFFTFS
jgi:hypothetical protein